MSFLHAHIITGPIRSRRLGASLGVNLLPTHRKFCNFNCVYCECGWGSTEDTPESIPSRQEVARDLKATLKKCRDEDIHIDSITFAGNGEPTLHPDFEGIINDAILLRDHYLPKCKVSVISNASQLDDDDIIIALKKVDVLMLKIDAGTASGFSAINQPLQPILLKDIIEKINKLDFPFWIQTLFFKGEVHGVTIDNTSGEEFDAWLQTIEKIKPKGVMIYGLDRETPAKQLIKLSKEDLASIAKKVQAIGIDTQTFY